MMILPLADTLQNCLQNLTSRIAGIDNEQMTGRVMGMSAMLGFGVGAIKEQFNSPSKNIKNGNSTDNNSSSLKGFVSRAKSIINPNMSLSDEKDYNGNINPIRNVLPKEKSTNNTTYNKNTNENISNNTTNKNTTKSVIGKFAKTGFNATKAYLSIGAKMAEGDFNTSSYKNNKNFKNNNLKSTEYLNKVAENKVNDNIFKKLGDSNEPKE